MRSTETRLRLTFADVLTTLLATAAGAIVITGCSGGTAGPGNPGTTSSGGGGGTGGGNTPDWTSICAHPELTSTSFLQGLTASPPFDGATYRNESAFYHANNPGSQGGVVGGDQVGDDWTGTSTGGVGALCSKATDLAACQAKVAGYRVLPATRDACKAAYPQTSYGPTECGLTYILYTRGDEIGVARTPDETKALAGTFDTFQEAIWVTQTATPALSTSCGSSSQGLADSQYRTTSDGGWDFQLYDESNCGTETFKVSAHVDYAGNLTIVSREATGVKPQCAVAGRRPEGLRLEESVAQDGNGVGAHFAAMATLEAASVVAFRRLRRQLAAFGAPEELLARITKAAKDEIRHARATGALARKYGVTPRAPELAAHDASPSLFAIALENAREGCVRETFGALVAHLQTTRAADADVRATMSAIADEETEHAALSWDIAAWIEARLGADERTALAAARREAFVMLARDLAEPVDLGVQHASGVPAPSEALRMLDGLAPLMLAA